MFQMQNASAVATPRTSSVHSSIREPLASAFNAQSREAFGLMETPIGVATTTTAVLAIDKKMFEPGTRRSSKRRQNKAGVLSVTPVQVAPKIGYSTDSDVQVLGFLMRFFGLFLYAFNAKQLEAKVSERFGRVVGTAMPVSKIFSDLFIIEPNKPIALYDLAVRALNLIGIINVTGRNVKRAYNLLAPNGTSAAPVSMFFQKKDERTPANCLDFGTVECTTFYNERDSLSFAGLATTHISPKTHLVIKLDPNSRTAMVIEEASRTGFITWGMLGINWTGVRNAWRRHGLLGVKVYITACIIQHNRNIDDPQSKKDVDRVTKLARGLDEIETDIDALLAEDREPRKYSGKPVLNGSGSVYDGLVTPN